MTSIILQKNTISAELLSSQIGRLAEKFKEMETRDEIHMYIDTGSIYYLNDTVMRRDNEVWRAGKPCRRNCIYIYEFICNANLGIIFDS